MSEWQTRGTQNPLRGFVRSFENIAKLRWFLPPSEGEFPASLLNIPPTSQTLCKSHQNRISADVAEWQTQATQNRSGNHVGSSPTIGTNRAVRTFSGSGLLYFCCKSHLCVLRENADNGIGRRYLTGKIQMGVNIAGGADVTMSKPLLNLFQAHAVGIE